MNKCKNPECQKDILETMNYCGEQCLRRHIEIKKAKGKDNPIPALLKIEDTETIHEIKEIMDMLGKSHSQGFVSGQHNCTILSYLRQNKTEGYQRTKAKLAWLCGIQQRYIQENYLDGIEAFGIIEIFMDEYNVKHWKWIGIKAIRNNGS